MTFAVGDVVKLKSGGPNMTIQRIFSEEETEYATCVWFENSTKKIEGFAIITLEKKVSEIERPISHHLPI